MLHFQTKKTTTPLINSVVSGDILKFLEYISPDEIDFIRRGTNFYFAPPKQLSRNGKPLIPCSELSLLHIAAFYDHLEMFILLQSQGIPLRVKSAAQYLPLHYACVGNAKEVVAYILENDPEQAVIELDVEFQPLNLATFANSPEILKMLFSHGCNTQSPKNLAGKPFDQALKSRNFDCLLILLESKCRTDVKASTMTPLMQAIVCGMNDAVLPLINRGIDPSFVNINGHTALSHACMLDQVENVRILCNRMDNIEIPYTNESKRASIVKYAIESKNPLILKMVIEKKCDINRFDATGESPVYSLLGNTSTSLQIDMLTLLLKHGLDINSRMNEKSLRFLEYIVIKYLVDDFSKLVEFLMRNGADPTLEMPNGKTLVDVVRTYSLSSSQREKNYYAVFKRFYGEHFE